MSDYQESSIAQLQYSGLRKVIRVGGLLLTLGVGIIVALSADTVAGVVAALVLLQLTVTAEVLLRGLEFEDWVRFTSGELKALDPASYLGDASRRYLRIVREVSKRREVNPDVARRFEELMREMEGLADGKMNFNTLDEAYSYKAARLKAMAPQDGPFRSTVVRADLVGANPAYTRASFAKYRDAMREACRRGVAVHRIYLIHDWTQLDDLLIEHLKVMNEDVGVAVRVIIGSDPATNQGDWERFQFQDLTIFGEQAASMHHPRDGGEYMFQEDAPHTARKAIAIFENMWNAPYAQPVERVLNDGVPQYRLFTMATAG